MAQEAILVNRNSCKLQAAQLPCVIFEVPQRFELLPVLRLKQLWDLNVSVTSEPLMIIETTYGYYYKIPTGIPAIGIVVTAT